MAEPVTHSRALPDPPATNALGGLLAAALPDDYRGWLVLLQGELGAGKSTLARALLTALGHDGLVPSPTYTLVEPYELPRGSVYHVDLYRISSADELHFLGFDELREGLMLVEWPERVPDLVDDADLLVALTYAGDGRRADITACSERATALVRSLG
ncbi:MAG: tRNA (adenosine(37)-N6)-threonylcarbamoyltransferase complex ATPase subunit type 1 TsaE [Woeseia sp.]